MRIHNDFEFVGKGISYSLVQFIITSKFCNPEDFEFPTNKFSIIS
jgi:hypothetical protein